MIGAAIRTNVAPRLSWTDTGSNSYGIKQIVPERMTSGRRMAIFRSRPPAAIDSLLEVIFAGTHDARDLLTA